jgi:hypothetical protein
MPRYNPNVNPDPIDHPLITVDNVIHAVVTVCRISIVVPFKIVKYTCLATGIVSYEATRCVFNATKNHIAKKNKKKADEKARELAWSIAYDEAEEEEERVNREKYLTRLDKKIVKQRKLLDELDTIHTLFRRNDITMHEAQDDMDHVNRRLAALNL